jgi:hypothetical protein
MVARNLATAASIAARLALYSALPVLRCDSILSIAVTLQTFVAEYDSGINGVPEKCAIKDQRTVDAQFGSSVID